MQYKIHSRGSKMKRKICEFVAHTVMAFGVILILCCMSDSLLTTICTLLVGAGLYFGAEIFDKYLHYLKGENK